MQLNTLQLALIFLNFLRLEAQANVQNNGWQKVLPDDFRRERDKSSARTRKIPQEDLRLRHEQHHLRQQQHEMAWERQLQQQLQQHLEDQQQQQQTESRPVRHLQHRSQPEAMKTIRQTPSLADDKTKILESYDENDNKALEFHSIRDEDDQVTASKRSRKQIETEHQRRKKEHQLKLEAEQKQRRRQLLTTTTRKHIDAKSKDNDDVKNTLHGNYINGRSQKREDFLRHKKYRALAHAHMNQVLKEATCRIPQKRCLLVQHDPSKIYTPHCTILHRCSEDSGCCPSRSQICAAKSTHNVELYFFVKSSRHRSDIEKRTFVNHTECHCIERSTYNEDLAMANNVQSLVLAAAERCTCPKTFEIFVKDDQCRCDCSSGNISCEWLKNGKEHFDMADRKCIKYGFCKTPTCTYGDYKKEEGGCPTDSDKQYDANGAKADKREN